MKLNIFSKNKVRKNRKQLKNDFVQATKRNIEIYFLLLEEKFLVSTSNTNEIMQYLIFSFYYCNNIYEVYTEVIAN